MRSLILIFFLLSNVCPLAKAQTGSPVIDLLQPEQTKLEWFTYEAANKLRLEKKRPDLVWYEVLYR